MVVWPLGCGSDLHPCSEVILDILWSLCRLAVSAYLGGLSSGVLWVFHMWHLWIHYLWLWNLHFSEHSPENSLEFICYNNFGFVFFSPYWRIFSAPVGFCPNIWLCWSSSKSHNLGSYCSLLAGGFSWGNPCHVLLQSVETILVENKVMENQKRI